jgi:hypothetical protein
MSTQERTEGDHATSAAWLTINSFDDLVKHEKQIIDRIEKTLNGPNLFMIHPFLLLADIGVHLSAQSKNEILEFSPQISGLSHTPYDALKRSGAKQNVGYRLKGLFRRGEK